jgi:hypothetical protein
MQRIIQRFFLIIFLLFYFSLQGISQNEFKKISLLIDKKETNKIKRGTTFNEVRLKMYKNSKPSFLKVSIDTLYMVETYNIEQGIFYGQIWNNQGNVAYSYTNHQFVYVKNQFPNYMRSLISKWDTVQIRNEENLYSTMINSNKIYATYIIKKSKEKYDIKSICFNNFFKVGRDNIE